MIMKYPMKKNMNTVPMRYMRTAVLKTVDFVLCYKCSLGVKVPVFMPPSYSLS